MLFEQVNITVSDLNQRNLNTLLHSQLFTKLIIKWNSFLSHLRCNNGELSAYWMSYIDLVENVVLGLLRGSREGNWDLHLNAIRSLIPWCFAYDKINYARHLTVYYAEIVSLPENKH